MSRKEGEIPEFCDYCGDKFNILNNGTRFVRYIQRTPYRSSERFFHPKCMDEYEKDLNVTCFHGLFPPVMTGKKH